ncbi:MAG: radical SAM protein [Candidatus Omnitrophota bacterium]
MKTITFVSFERHYYDRHQFYYLSAYLKSKGFKVCFISENRFNAAIKRLKTDKPDLLGYSTFSNNGNVYIEFDKFQKNILGIKSIIGGPGAIFNPEFFINTTIDAVCVGEGEDALIQYLQTDGISANNVIVNGNISTLQYNPLVDLDRLPFPDREIVYNEEPYLKIMKYRMFLSGRGCPYGCSYCHNHIFNKRFKNCGKVVRKKSVNYFIEEIKRVNVKYNPRLIVMQDDTFIIDRKWLFEFCERYKKAVKKPFACNVRANLVDEEVVKNLKEAGCICCVWSIESGNDYLRNTILKRNMSREQIMNTADLLNKYGIKHRIGNIIGIPHETYATIRETIELNIRCKPHLALANTLVPYPHLEISEYAIKSGYLKPNYYNALPGTFWNMSILNFSHKEKIKFLKTMYLFPLFVNTPWLYKNLMVRKILYRIPAMLLKYIHVLTDMFKMLTLYPFGAGFSDILAIVAKYFKYTITWKIPKYTKANVKSRSF